MRARIFVPLLVAAALLALPGAGFAQEATITGTVVDSTGGVLPGVTVTATNTATGNVFFAVADGTGSYRMPVRVGTYTISAELPGFAAISHEGLAVLVGQTASVDFQMRPSGLQETVTVTGEAPLIQTTTSSIGENINPIQMQELPVQGRGWTTLALMAAGNRTTAVSENPQENRGDVQEFQLNMDGQQITNNTAGPIGQPLYSRDAIAEFQFISNRFDASQGRSSGVQVNAISKSGTNAYAGSFAGYFRDSRFNAADPVLGIVREESEQQFSTTFGGPIRQDRIHFFANFEYQRRPSTAIWNTAFPEFNISLPATSTTKMGGVRGDVQFTPEMRLMVKTSMGVLEDPCRGCGGRNHPGGATEYYRQSRDVLSTLTNVIGSRAVNEFRVGFAKAYYWNELYPTWSNHPLAVPGMEDPGGPGPRVGLRQGGPRISFRGFQIAGNSNSPQNTAQNQWNIRNDFNFSYEAAGRHDLRIGGEAILMHQNSGQCRTCRGRIFANAGPISALDKTLPEIFPDPFNADTWDLAALSPITSRVFIGIGSFRQDFSRESYAGYVQDDWTLSDRLTLNLGLRYDLYINAWAQEVEILPWLEADRPTDADNVQPRVGFAYSLDDRTVLRGGGGLYYGDFQSNILSFTYSFAEIASIGVPNDGRPDFAANWFNGPLPTAEEAFARFCSGPRGRFEGCLERDINELAPNENVARSPYSWQTSLGVARQLGDTMAVEADYVYLGSRNEKKLQDNINVGFNPETGVNHPFSDRSTRPFPDWGKVGMTPFAGWSDYHALQTKFTKRMSGGIQASGNYALSWLRDADPAPMSGLDFVTFPVAPDLGEDYTLTETDQRHRLVFNGVWQMAYGFQVSGLYFFGSGERYFTPYGGDLRDFYGDAGLGRLRPDGTLSPRAGFVGDPVHRVDMRIQKRFNLGGAAAIDGMVEMFNVFNRANFGSYDTEESSRRFGQPNASTNIAYAPRTMQFGFRVTF